MNKKIASIEDFDIKGKNLFLRLDLNVPLKGGKITDETRIQAALPTIRYALDKGARLVVASHFGRPSGNGAEDRKKYTLKPVAERLRELLNVEVLLTEDPDSEAPRALLSNLKPNQIIMLENLRFDEGETENAKKLAETFAKYTDIYINDAFGASHRAHASIVGLPSMIEKVGVGFLMKKEIEVMDQILAGEQRPFVAILGGAKVSDKVKVIEKLIEKVDTLLIGGAMAYTFLKAKKISTGSSLVEKEWVSFAGDLLKKAEVKKKNILLPVDHRVVPKIEATDKVITTFDNAVPEGHLGVDIGPLTAKLYAEKIAAAKMVFWNGPMGIFETKEYSQGTFAVAQALADNKNFTVVGGGDSASAVHAAGVAEEVSYISTGGGASLEYLQGDDLPGLMALSSKARKM